MRRMTKKEMTWTITTLGTSKLRLKMCFLMTMIKRMTKRWSLSLTDLRRAKRKKVLLH